MANNTFNEWVDLREEFNPKGSVAPQALGVAKDLRRDPKKQAIAQMGFLKAIQQVAIRSPEFLARIVNVLRQGVKDDPDLVKAIQQAKQGMRQYGQQHQPAPDPEPGMPTQPTRGVQPR